MAARAHPPSPEAKKTDFQRPQVFRLFPSSEPILYAPATFDWCPFCYTTGAYADMMNRLADEHGEQFRPCQLMMDHAREDKKFHS